MQLSRSAPPSPRPLDPVASPRIGSLLAGVGGGLATPSAPLGRLGLLGLLGLAGCPRPAPPEGPAPAAAAAPRAWALPVPELVDVACTPTRCLLLTRSGLVDLATRAPLPGLPARSWDALRLDGGGLVVSWLDPGVPGGRLSAPLGLDPTTLGEATPDPLPPAGEWDVDAPLAGQVERVVALEKRVVEAGWRRPFTHLAVTAGSPVAYLRASGGTAQLMRSGSPPATARFTAPEATAGWPAPFALAPGGRELYVLAWPSGTLLALDPQSLVTRWTVPLGAAAQGLFVEPEGRWMLAAVGPGATDRLVDWPIPGLDPASPRDPSGDEDLRRQERPRVEAVVAVDLAARQALPLASGRHRRWLVVEAAAVPADARAGLGVSDATVPWRLLATDQGVVIFPSPPLPSPE